MKRSESNNPKETPEQEVDRLRKRVAKLESEKAEDKATIKELRKELKKKDVPMITVSEEQRRLLSSLFPGIGSLFR